MKRIYRFRYGGLLVFAVLSTWVASYLMMRWQAASEKGVVQLVVSAGSTSVHFASTDSPILDFQTPDWLVPATIIYLPLQEFDAALTERKLTFNEALHLTQDYKF